MSIITHHPARERDHVPPTSVALVVSPRSVALAQRTELHLDLPDSVLADLAVRSTFRATVTR